MRGDDVSWRLYMKPFKVIIYNSTFFPISRPKHYQRWYDTKISLSLCTEVSQYTSLKTPILAQAKVEESSFTQPTSCAWLFLKPIHQFHLGAVQTCWGDKKSFGVSLQWKVQSHVLEISYLLPSVLNVSLSFFLISTCPLKILTEMPYFWSSNPTANLG